MKLLIVASVILLAVIVGPRLMVITLIFQSSYFKITFIILLRNR